MSANSTAVGAWVCDEWLDPQTLQRSCNQFRSDRFTSIVLDDFIKREKLRLLQECFDRDAQFSIHYGLMMQGASAEDLTGERAVTEAVFNESAEEVRLACEQLMRGPAPGRKNSAGWQANLDFTRLLASTEFASLLTGMTGVDRLERMTYMPRTMLHGDFCRAHSDAGGRRRLCMLLYVDGGWREGFGGRFQHLEHGAVTRSLAPIANRVVIHEPRTDLIHQVEPISEIGRAWKRQTYSIWFSAAS